MKDFLFTQRGKQYLMKEYVEKERSTYDIAKERSTYANKVRRALLRHGIELRDKQKAQLAALNSGRHVHPTRGRQRTQEERQRISDGMAKAWKKMSPEELERRREIARRQWGAMSEDERQRLLALAGEGMRRAAADGSKLEKAILVGLNETGYNPRFHAKLVIDTEEIQVDILLEKQSFVIEVDGPSHHLPIWGEEQLSKTMQADNRKTGLLVNAGYVVVRVKCLTKTVSKHQKRTALNEVLKAIRSVEEEFPPLERRLVEIEVTV